MTSKTLCKYYQSGCCAFGDDCRFSHDKRDALSQVCTYFLAGSCKYGDRCRYEHVRPDWHTSSNRDEQQSSYQAPQVPKPAVDPVSSSRPAAGSSTGAWGTADADYDEDYYSGELDVAGLTIIDREEEAVAAVLQGSDPTTSQVTDPADLPLCSEFTRSGRCRKGEACALIHGNECSMCGRMALHPYNPEASEQHLLECSAQVGSG